LPNLQRGVPVTRPETDDPSIERHLKIPMEDEEFGGSAGKKKARSGCDMVDRLKAKE
jgi:hypothetical protein